MIQIQIDFQTEQQLKTHGVSSKLLYSILSVNQFLKQKHDNLKRPVSDQ